MYKHKKNWQILLLIIIILSISLMFIVLNKKLFTPNNSFNNPLLNKSLPNFKLQGWQLKSQNYLNKLQKYDNKILFDQDFLLVFWASWCQVCQQENKILQQIKSKYNLPIIGIAFADDINLLKKNLSKYSKIFDYLLIDDGNFSINMGVIGVPEIFAIDNIHNIKNKFIGALSLKKFSQLYK